MSVSDVVRAFSEDDDLLDSWCEEEAEINDKGDKGAKGEPPLWSWVDGLVLGVAVVAWMVGLLTLPSEEVGHLWFMPLIGICSATVGNTFPVAGGVLFVPFFLIVGLHIKNAVAFSVATQTIGNGVFGVTSWLVRDSTAFVLPVIPVILCAAWSGVLLSILVFPISNDYAVQALFGIFSLLVAARVLYQLCATEAEGEYSSTNTTIKLDRLALLVLLPCGFVGGLCVGYIGIGVETITFFALTLVWRLDVRRATVTSIAIIGGTSALAFILHLAVAGYVPIHRWLMVLPGIAVGARAAPRVHHALGHRTILALLVILLMLSALKAFHGAFSALAS